MRPLPTPVLPTLLAATALVLAGCGAERADDATATATGGGQAGLTVLAGFYPLEFVAARVGGERVTVSSLTPPGVEAHDLELSPRDVAGVGDADLVVYLQGFQPAVDDAVAQEAPDSSLEVGAVAGLDLEPAADHSHDEDAHDEDAHGDDAHDEDADEHDETGADPHFWLDPTKLAKVADATADRLSDLDPEGAAEYRDNAASLTADLGALDEEIDEALSTCETRTMVVSHEAFGYLAERYDLEQVGIAGLTPDDEPSAAQMADLVRFVDDNDVRTVYYETLVSPEVAETIAAEAGAETAVLDPLEGLTDEAAGSDYLEVMRANLAALQAGQPCP
ncbi:MAG TPA: metal ABC transporter substrate-binding protein [Jiangellales bacterium]|nr:metal ABC transporter substrate-binding protein [Jiangellales bacterium]